jgi:hypothetical protein
MLSVRSSKRCNADLVAPLAQLTASATCYFRQCPLGMARNDIWTPNILYILRNCWGCRTYRVFPICSPYKYSAIYRTSIMFKYRLEPYLVSAHATLWCLDPAGLMQVET